MHKTGACLPKLGQADPLGQALMLDPGLPPEQLLAPARGHTLRRRVLGPCFVAEGPAETNTFGKSV
jgi:hypothetical protein